jgi:hypothetical protein
MLHLKQRQITMTTFDENMDSCDRFLVEKVICDCVNSLSEEELCDLYTRVVGEPIFYDDVKKIFFCGKKGE